MKGAYLHMLNRCLAEFLTGVYILKGLHRNSDQLRLIHSFIHSGDFYSTSSSPLLLRGSPDYSINTGVNTKRYRQLRVKDLPKVPMQRLSWIRTCDLPDARCRTDH